MYHVTNSMYDTLPQMYHVTNSMIHCPKCTTLQTVWYTASNVQCYKQYDTLPQMYHVTNSMVHCPKCTMLQTVWCTAPNVLCYKQYGTLPQMNEYHVTNCVEHIKLSSVTWKKRTEIFLGKHAPMLCYQRAFCIKCNLVHNLYCLCPTSIISQHTPIYYPIQVHRSQLITKNSTDYVGLCRGGKP